MLRTFFASIRGWSVIVLCSLHISPALTQDTGCSSKSDPAWQWTWLKPAVHLNTANSTAVCLFEYIDTVEAASCTFNFTTLGRSLIPVKNITLFVNFPSNKNRFSNFKLQVCLQGPDEDSARQGEGRGGGPDWEEDHHSRPLWDSGQVHLDPRLILHLVSMEWPKIFLKQAEGYNCRLVNVSAVVTNSQHKYAWNKSYLI